MKMQVNKETEHLLVVDEIQKITNWSETVKSEWDRDSREKRNLKVVILGSSRTLIIVSGAQLRVSDCLPRPAFRASPALAGRMGAICRICYRCLSD